MMASYSPRMSRRARANSLEKAEAKASDPKSIDIKALTFSSYMLVRKAISSSLVCWTGGEGVGEGEVKIGVVFGDGVE